MYLLSGMWIIWCGLVAIAGTAVIAVICLVEARNWVGKLFKDLTGATAREEAEEKAKAKATAGEIARCEAARVVRNAALKVELRRKGGIDAVILTNRLKDDRAWEAAGKPAGWTPYTHMWGPYKPLTTGLDAALRCEAQQRADGVWSDEIDPEDRYSGVCNLYEYYVVVPGGWPRWPKGGRWNA